MGFVARLLLALSSLSPVLITWVIVNFCANGFRWFQVVLLAVALFLVFICYILVSYLMRSLGHVSINVISVKSIDNEAVSYIIAYLFPLISPGSDAVLFISVFLFLAFIMYASNAFTFNPILTLFGLHFYEIQSKSGVSYILLSVNDITDVNKIKKVIRLSGHVMLDFCEA